MHDPHKLLSTLFGNTGPGFNPPGLGVAGNLFGTNAWFAPSAAWQALPLDVGAPGLGAGSPGTSDPSAILLSPGDSRPRHGSGSGGTSSGGTGTSTTTSPSTTTGSLVINVNWDSSVQAAPSGFKTGVMAAVQYLESQFTDPVSININVGYGEENGYSLGSGTLGQSQAYVNSVGYSQLVSALSADSTTATDASAVASLPSSSPVNGTIYTTSAQAKALGLAPANGTSVDGYVGFSSTLPFTYDSSGGVAGGTYDFNGVALHELTEVMGRELFTGMTLGSGPAYSAYDLFHYSAPGVRDLSASTPGYFSVDGGTTALAAFNTASGGDAGDWASSVTNDSADAFSTAGVVNNFSTADLTAMDAIGWNLGSAAVAPAPAPSPSPSPSPSPAPTGVSVSVATSNLAGVQGATGLSANQTIASVVQTGGTSGDQFTYSLGGAGASAFTLTTSNNAATLSVGSAGAPGAANGELYALTVTATDTTAGTASPATGLDIVVAGSGGDTVPVSALVGASASDTPTLIYGLGGADAINASGMTGNLWFVGGAGGDTMTGGSGANDYLYAATTDSTSSAMDVITNFNAGIDKIDLTGLGTSLSYAGAIKMHGRHAQGLAAHSIGWMQSGGNTYVLVNTSSGTQSVGSTSMEIELRGGISLSAGNFLHQ